MSELISVEAHYLIFLWLSHYVWSLSWISKVKEALVDLFTSHLYQLPFCNTGTHESDPT